ncbi:MAG TPA: hypothetical protein PLP58_15990, partial [Prosthecobacter sp.]|nr:hypothetical protein [Prosthecobacter sp.]
PRHAGCGSPGHFALRKPCTSRRPPRRTASVAAAGSIAALREGVLDFDPNGMNRQPPFKGACRA